VKTHTIVVDPKAPQADVIGKAVEALRRGGLVAFPTDTLYALGADALAADAVERVLTVKGRARGKPLSVLVPSVDAIASLDVSLAAGVPHALRAFWPGPLTVVVKAGGKFPSVLTGATGTVGLRIPAGPVAQAILAGFGRPVIGTSANKAGGPDPGDAKTVQRAIGGQIDLILDGGRVALGVPSTVLDCTAEPARILREGAISRAKLAAAIALA
jgi:L-threonylcarbamoyladenylate synthase